MSHKSTDFPAIQRKENTPLFTVLKPDSNGKVKPDASNFGKTDADQASQAQEPKTETQDDAQPRKSPFQAKTAAQWLADEQNRPIPKKLFGDFVIESEITCLFASTNVGKSICAVQIGQAIASGTGRDPFTVQGGGRKVLYFDFELSSRQFARRYSQDNGQTFCNPFNFDGNFIRLQNDYAQPEDGQTMTEYYLDSIKAEIDLHGAKVVIIDNLTWIAAKLEKAADAAPFMMGLTRLKREKDLTLILLAHTPKRDQTRPLDIYDLQGSAMIANFVDAAFAIGRSQQDAATRYIKQVKARDAEIVCGAENVAVCTMGKEGSFLGFTFRYYEEERTHLKQRSEADDSERDDKIMEMHRAGKSYRAIAEEVGTNLAKVQRIVQRNKGDGLLIDNPAFMGDDDEPLF